MSMDVLGRRQRTNTNNEDKRQDVQLIKNQDKIFFTNIYIYIRIFL